MSHLDEKVFFCPVKSVSNIITKAGVFMLSCIRTQTSLLLLVQLLYVGKVKKPKQVDVLDVDQTSFITTCKTKHSILIKIQQG